WFHISLALFLLFNVPSLFFFSCYVPHLAPHSFPTRRSSDLQLGIGKYFLIYSMIFLFGNSNLPTEMDFCFRTTSPFGWTTGSKCTYKGSVVVKTCSYPIKCTSSSNDTLY